MRIAALLAAGFALSSCAVHQHAFRVIPARPDYLLQMPGAARVPFPDVLSKYNGFRDGQPFIDLRPGMQLRVENAYYQPGASRRGLAGFLGTEIAQYRVASQGLVLLSTKPMAHRPAGESAVEQLISKPVSRYPFYRFYFEILFKQNGDAHGSVLLGATSYADLEGLATQLEQQPEAVCSDQSPHCAVFPEACSVAVEIEILVNHRQTTLPWTSRLSAVTQHPQSLSLLRLYQGRLLPVRLNVHDAAMMALPLLPGDEIDWR